MSNLIPTIHSVEHSVKKFDLRTPTAIAKQGGSITGSETCIWVNGAQGVDAATPAAIDLTSAQKLALFARGNLSTGLVANGGKIYHIALIPFKLTPTQIRQITSQLLNTYS